MPGTLKPAWMFDFVIAALIALSTHIANVALSGFAHLDLNMWASGSFLYVVYNDLKR